MDDEQDQADAEWSQLELEQQQRRREELIHSCKREPLEPLFDPLPPGWPVDPLSRAQRDLEMAQVKALDYALRRIYRT